MGICELESEGWFKNDNCYEMLVEVIVCGVIKLEVSYASLWLMLWGEVKEVRKGLKGLRLKCLDPCYINGKYNWNWE
jgi:predicted butyrate kinase (DUF1464 family)